jgi:hypothetical protein
MTAYENAISNVIAGQQNLWNRVTGVEALKTTSRLVYNAGISKEAYFRSQSAQTGGFNIGNQSGLNGRNGLWRILQTDSAGNTPSSIDWASSLWSKAQAYKGMIAASKHKEALPATDDKDAAKTTPLPSPESFDKVNYGFQFHYNPGSLSMAYGGPPAVDVALQASGREEYLTYGSAAGAGTISMKLILNRINDMKYFDPATGRLKSGVSLNAFAGRAPSLAELGDIYNKGTMYDMEFLFRTLLGYAYDSFLGRGMSWDKKTSDLGWLGGKPVEIHLGKSLRYLGRIASLSIDHVLFTERMVPTFSEVTIGITRLPDIGAPQGPAYTKVVEPPAQTGPIVEPGGTSATVTVAGNGTADPWAPLKWLWDNIP